MAASGTRTVVVLVFLLGAALLASYLFSVNRISLEVEHPALDGGQLDIMSGDSELVRFVVDPARRVDGVTVSVDGTSVAHPAGELAVSSRGIHRGSPPGSTISASASPGRAGSPP